MLNSKVSLLIVGATGSLGSLITKHCLAKPNLQVNVLVRNPNKSQQLCDQVVRNGGKIIVGDVTNQTSLKGATKGIHTLISALIGSDETVVQGQKVLLQDGLENGLSRYLPSDFSLDYRQVQPHEHLLLAQRILFRQILKESKIKGIHIFNGGFMETFWQEFLQSEKSNETLTLECWGSDETQIDLTTYEDTARFVASVVAQPESTGDYEIVGESISYKKIAQIYTKVRGKPAKTRVLGTTDQLVALRNQLQSKLPEDFRKYILTAYAVPMFDGRGKLKNPCHAKFGINPVGVEQYLKSNPNF